MPLRSKTTVKVHEIPAGTTKQQYVDFVEHLCTKPKKPSKFHFTRFARPFRRKSKLPMSASKSASTENIDEDPRSKDESEICPVPSSLRGEGEQAAPLLDDPRSTARGWTRITYCRQNGHLLGTVSFESEILKDEALKRHEKDNKSYWKDWVVEDDFQGVTVIYEGPDAKFDICAVHGQDGNAMDTWTAVNGKMWLRDLLPEHENFINSRIMTFGYDSDLTDKITVMGLDDWAETLLRSLNEVRTSDTEKARPLLLVCHSLGGLVVKKAMTQLSSVPKYNNIALSRFGIVFLATPHSGSEVADWNDFLVATAHVLGGVRIESVKTLQPFNAASVRDAQAFIRLKPCPPFRCFAEGRMMRVGHTDKHVVTLSSATLGDQQAYQIMNVDHVTICKFDSKLGPFTTISMELLELLSEVTRHGMQQSEPQRERRMFGQPRFQAHAYPPEQGFWWEGNELSEIQHQLTLTRPFFGRYTELEILQQSLITNVGLPKLTVIKGIAGIGKTELLLQFASKQKGRRNVFFLASRDGETFESALGTLSTRIGFDMIDNTAVNQERWRHTPDSERIHIFTKWLSNACNKESLFIVDDIEAFGYSKIQTILKYPVHYALVSTRDSNLNRADRYFQDIILPPLSNTATKEFLTSMVNNLSTNTLRLSRLDSVADKLQGHPLAIRNAIPFILEHFMRFDDPIAEFLDLFESQKSEERRLFLEFNFEGRSLWEAFDTSFQRLLLQENSEEATKLIQILPFLSPDKHCIDQVLHMDKSWFHECQEGLPDMAILETSPRVISSWLSKLRGVSFYILSSSQSTSRDLNFHPLILQYMLLHIDDRTRINLMRQVLHLCYMLEDKGAARMSQIRPHVVHCTRVRRGLGIPRDSLGLPVNIVQWVKTCCRNAEVGVHPLDESNRLKYDAVNKFITSCREIERISLDNKGPITDEATIYRVLENCRKDFIAMQELAEGEDGIPKPLRPAVLDATEVFQNMVRLRSNYPELINELEGLKNRLKVQ
ncbi:uncharacterized protein FFB20_12367 [Fusarium fujikuroi]|nr:uncharacterized protein FFE2_00126 [Fusarium fujikuroi]SCN68809.1 uncharacterized protein FFC1_00123 [Fusarium fujikuroi]SCN71199.1 uncharacterized protein FFM5_00090 [Fusarium fujikuroi]SCO05698.1 uncharacterized protein FFB20_12367 [Fusarium fujikuroi]SCO28087.1 uncharacterized protein FFNC_00124 [Fusarium fujikuroi]